MGGAVDLGAVEYGSPALLHIRRSAPAGVEIFVLGVKNQTCRLLMCTTLADWEYMAKDRFPTNGTLLFHDNIAAGAILRLYRVALP